jgi:hypothetical protein
MTTSSESAVEPQTRLEQAIEELITRYGIFACLDEIERFITGDKAPH